MIYGSNTYTVYKIHMWYEIYCGRCNQWASSFRYSNRTVNWFIKVYKIVSELKVLGHVLIGPLLV